MRARKLTESQVTRQICDFLRAHGWRVCRQQSGLFATTDGRRIRIGERGAADWWAVRAFGDDGRAEFFFLEVKGTGRAPSDRQRSWINDANRDGLEAEWFDSFERFEGWYFERYDVS